MAKRKKKQRGKEAKPFDPSIDTGAKRPVTARVAVGDVNDKYSDYPSNGLTPGRLARIFRQADEGDVRAQMELFEEMEEKDTHLFSQMQTRKLAVTGLDWEVQPFSKDDRDKEIADFVDEQLKSIENFDKGHIYKKFSIPEPEEGEEVLKPPVKQMAPAVAGSSEILPEKTSPEDVKALKDGVDEQQQVDGIVSMANKQAADIFREMLKPILKVIDTASDMDELQAVLKDEAKLKKLYGQMESPELDDMIQQGIYLSHLVGRSMD